MEVETSHLVSRILCSILVPILVYYDIPITISFFIFVIVDPMGCYILCLASCKSFSIGSFSTIKNLIVELVASA